MKTTTILSTLLLLLPSTARAHDSWLETNTPLVRTRDVVHVELFLGNHGNDHRDFKLAGKLDLNGTKFEIVLPDGQKLDLLDRLVDMGYTPGEGYWATRFVPMQPGLYVAASQSDNVMSYGPVRAVKCAKTYFLASPTLDRVDPSTPGFDRPLGQPLELVPLVNPIAPMGPGVPIKLQLLYRGRPLAGERVSFIPRGETLTAELDPRYERMTDAEGRVEYSPTMGTYLLVGAHHVEPTEKGEKFDRTKYSATLVIYVPQTCPCCD